MVIYQCSNMAAQSLARAVVITVLFTEVSLGLETEADQWGETHQRDTVVVLPSSSGDQAYSLADLPLTKEWGLVEINSDTDLAQAEFSSRIDTEPAPTEVETEVGTKTEASTEAPSDQFKVSSQDPWSGQTTAAPPLIVDERFYHPTQDQLDWTWTPESSGEISAPQPQVVSISSPPSSSPAEAPVLSPPAYPPPTSVATGPSYPPVAPAGLGYHQAYTGGYTAVGYPPAAAGAAGDKTAPGNEGAAAAAGVFTRLKQKLSFPLEKITQKIQTGFSSLSHRADGGSRLPSLSSVRKQIKSALGLPETLTVKSSEPGSGLLDVTKQKLQSVNLALRNFVSNSKDILNKPSPPTSAYQSPEYQTSYDSTQAVTEIPIPLPVPTYLPVRKSGEFSAGFQVLMQYVVAMIGVAMVLAI